MRLNQWKSLLTTHQIPLTTHPEREQGLSAPTAEQLQHYIVSKFMTPGTLDEPEQPKLTAGDLDTIERLQTAIDQIKQGKMHGLGLFYCQDDGYHSTISTMNCSDLFGLTGYITASTEYYIQNHIDYSRNGDDDDEDEDDE